MSQAPLQTAQRRGGGVGCIHDALNANSSSGRSWVAAVIVAGFFSAAFARARRRR